VAFEIQWPARAVPIDPSPRPRLTVNQCSLPVQIMLNQPSNPKLISLEGFFEFGE
jgi:hypothetical protein